MTLTERLPSKSYVEKLSLRSAEKEVYGAISTEQMYQWIRRGVVAASGDRVYLRSEKRWKEHSITIEWLSDFLKAAGKPAITRQVSEDRERKRLDEHNREFQGKFASAFVLENAAARIHIHIEKIPLRRGVEKYQHNWPVISLPEPESDRFLRYLADRFSDDCLEDALKSARGSFLRDDESVFEIDEIHTAKSRLDIVVSVAVSQDDRNVYIAGMSQDEAKFLVSENEITAEERLFFYKRDIGAT